MLTLQQQYKHRVSAFGKQPRREELVVKKNLCAGDLLVHAGIGEGRPSRFSKNEFKPANFSKSIFDSNLNSDPHSGHGMRKQEFYSVQPKDHNVTIKNMMVFRPSIAALADESALLDHIHAERLAN
jgi:hypothetical protein